MSGRDSAAAQGTIVVLAACPFPTSQGSQVLIHQMSEVLAGLGHSVHVVAYPLGEPAAAPPYHLHRASSFFRYSKLRAGPSWKKPLLDLLLAYKALSIVRRYHGAVLHAHNYEAAIAGYCVRLLTGTPVLYHSHNAMADELHTYFQRPWAKKLARWFGAWLDRNIPRRADFCIAIHAQLASYLEKQGVPSSRLAILPPGAFPNEFRIPPAESIRRKYRLPRGSTLIYTGNLDAYQDLELLFAAIRNLANLREDFLLLVVSHCDPSPYQRLAAELGIERFVQFVTTNRFHTVAELLELSDIAVIPRTSWSGFPIKLVNYMAAGKAIAASQGSAKGIVHLENGWVTPDGDVEALTAALDRLLNDRELRERLGAAAFRTAIRQHNWARIGKRLEQIHELLAHIPNPGD